MSQEKRWRCGKCGKTHHAVKPACPHCGLDPAENPRYRAVFAEVVTIHFDPPSKMPGMGAGHRACTPAVKGFAGQMATGVAACVTCEECRQTETWKRQYEVEGEPGWVEGQDETVEPAAKG